MGWSPPSACKQWPHSACRWTSISQEDHLDSVKQKLLPLRDLFPPAVQVGMCSQQSSHASSHVHGHVQQAPCGHANRHQQRYACKHVPAEALHAAGASKKPRLDSCWWTACGTCKVFLKIDLEHSSKGVPCRTPGACCTLVWSGAGAFHSAQLEGMASALFYRLRSHKPRVLLPLLLSHCCHHLRCAAAAAAACCGVMQSEDGHVVVQECPDAAPKEAACVSSTGKDSSSTGKGSSSGGNKPAWLKKVLKAFKKPTRCPYSSSDSTAVQP